MNDKNNTDGILIGVSAIIMLMLAIFIMRRFEPHVNAIMGGVAWFHVLPFSALLRMFPFLESVPVVGPWVLEPADAARTLLDRGGYARFMTVDPAYKSVVMTASARAAFIFYGPVMIVAGLKGVNFRIDQLYRRRHSIETMIREQARTWPVLRMALWRNPRQKKDLSSRMAAKAAMDMARGIHKASTGSALLNGGVVDVIPSSEMRSSKPEEWLMMRGVTFDPVKYREYETSLFNPSDLDFTFPAQWGRITIDDISEVLERQLRTPWRGARALPPHLRAIFAACTMSYDFDRDGFQAFIDDLGVLGAHAAATGKDMRDLIEQEPSIMSRMDKAIRSRSGEQMEFMASRHAYVESALPAILMAGRTNRGVIASAVFLWMKYTDRASWYILSATGNDVVAVEAAGAYAHYRAETQIGTPIVRPCVYQASRSILHDYLDMSPDRAEKKRIEEERRRNFAQQFSLAEAQVAAAQSRPKTGDPDSDVPEDFKRYVDDDQIPKIVA